MIAIKTEEKKESYLPLAMTIGMFGFFLNYDPYILSAGTYGFLSGFLGTFFLIFLISFIFIILENRKKNKKQDNLLTKRLIEELNEIIQKSEKSNTVTIKIDLKKNQQPTLHVENYG